VAGSMSPSTIRARRHHAHLLVTYPPKVALGRCPFVEEVMSLKMISSAPVRSHGWWEVTRALHGEHFWSPSYAVVSWGSTRRGEVIRGESAVHQQTSRAATPR